MSAECHVCGFDISYPVGTWPVGLCLNCTQTDRINELQNALRELIALKDGPRDADYERRKPEAWANARAALSPTSESA